jgi:hypothetical protein
MKQALRLMLLHQTDKIVDELVVLLAPESLFPESLLESARNTSLIKPLS